MSKLTQEPPSNNDSVSIQPYVELVLKTLLWQLTHFRGDFGVWLLLDRSGRMYLEEEGLLYEDIQLAASEGIRRGLILRRNIAGCPAIALKRLVQR